MFNAKWLICQPYHCEKKLLSMRWWCLHCTRSTHSAVLSSLKQQSTCRFTQDTLSRFWANVSLLLLLNATCLEEKQQIPIIVFGVSTLTITPPMWFKTLPVLDTTASCFFPLNIHVIAQCTLKLEIIPKYYILLNQTKKFRGHQYILLTVFKTDPNLHLACLSQRACWRISQSLIVPLLLLYTNKLHSNGWNSAAVITSVNSSILAGFISTISDTVKETIFYSYWIT